MLGLAVVVGGAFGAYWYLSSGPQPAEALPDTTIAYVSIDLDPSGAQKIEALRTLKKFPALADQLDFNTDDDIRQRLFEEFRADLDCPGLDYGDDISPWLGDRAALAAVDIGETDPAAVFVLQVQDADDADAGLSKIRDCSSVGAGGWAINGDWAVVAETDDIAKTVSDSAEAASLADDDDYQKWTTAAGDQGIVTMYAAPAAGRYLVEAVDSLSGSMGLGYEPVQPILPDDIRTSIEGFDGAAATIRFDDGSLEVELASDPGLAQTSMFAGGNASDVLARLPDDTAAAVGVGFADGWFGDLVDAVASQSDGSTSAAELIAQMESDTGLDLPADAETLAGDSAALSFGSDFDVEVINSGDWSDLPIALAVKGDADAIQAVLAKVQPTLGPWAGTFLDADTDGDLVVIGPQAPYRDQVLAHGDLGDSAVFKDVVREADRADAIGFVNFDTGDWLLNLANGDDRLAQNLEPLSGAGISSWTDDTASHTVLRITTN
ncbi:MAG: hypothetical protein JWM79_937 [Nocardioides sp.]|nr:hypothetical protein [Nocardioides sp.]